MMALKSGEERLKEMEAEMALFEQEVLGGPVAVTAGGPPVVEAVPVALAVPAVQALPVVRPIIGTNTYQQVQQSLEARAATLVGPPPPAFVGPAVPAVRPPPMMRPAFVPHILQRPGGPRVPMMRGPPPQGMMAPPLPRPPPPPPMMMAPPMAGPPQHPMGPIGPPMGPMNPVTPQVDSMNPIVVTPPRPGTQAPPKVTPSVIQAAPTVYTTPPAPKRPDMRAQRQAHMEELAASIAEQQAAAMAAIMAAGLLEAKKDSVADDSVIGPSMPEPEPVHVEPPESITEDKKKGKQEKVKKCIRTAAGTTWEDSSLSEWDSDDFRIFCGDLGNEVNDDILTRAFSRYPSFLKAKVVRDKRTGKTKGYGFVSFKDPNDYVRAMREMNGKYVGSRPIKLRKSTWKDRNLEIVRKKQKEKKKLGLR
ncbi:RNA-binding protein 42 isoform X1 [Neoarius graeffei]|uniref:RNA-binding protein 42 isoform X1 n=1 Tax=Neoarius graeffei TaxID=443677 RepID=UPI00298BCE0B|nr:RNA-binding protein 42 isoform X1 [Neoarius graeffei]XP_060756188.1 RNA-binding protein 42 isoform X1 [Neoarius graeffei]